MDLPREVEEEMRFTMVGRKRGAGEGGERP